MSIAKLSCRFLPEIFHQLEIREGKKDKLCKVTGLNYLF